MTVLQDWFTIRTVDPRYLRAMIQDTLRDLTGNDDDLTVPPTLPTMALQQPGIERC